MQKTKQKSSLRLITRISLSLAIIFNSFALAGMVMVKTVQAEESSSNEIGQTSSMRFESSDSGTIIFDADSKESPITVADVSLDNIKIISQNTNRFKVSFDVVNNSSQVQPSIKYGVFLVLENDILKYSELMPLYKAEYTVDQKIYSEEITLDGNSRINRTIEYIAPSYLVGEYLLFAEAYISSGLPLGTQGVNDPIILKGSNQFLEIVPSSCHLTIEGGDVDREYNIAEGISIDPQKEKLIGICKVINHFHKKIKAVPTFETYRRSPFGEKVNESQSTLGEFQFGPMKEETISFVLPVNMEPQAYDTKVFLKIGEKIVSNSIFMHYVLKGAGATIQNVTFDKSSYLKGETAQIILLWTGSADQFPDSRVEGTAVKDLTVDLFIGDKENNQICGQATQKLDSRTPSARIAVPITKDCNNPIILNTIKDKEGKILAQKESQVPDRGLSKFNRRTISLTILVSVFALVIAMALNIKRKK